MTSHALINLKFPSYSFETTLTLKKPFKALGMISAFDENGAADFSKMTEDENDLYIGDVVHKTFIGLDDVGIEAAAATAVIMEAAEAVGEPDPRPEINLDLDRPYFFVIYESSTQTPLFVGRVMDPSK